MTTQELQQMINKGWLTSEEKSRRNEIPFKKKCFARGTSWGQVELQGGQAGGQVTSIMRGPRLEPSDTNLTQTAVSPYLSGISYKERL